MACLLAVVAPAVAGTPDEQSPGGYFTLYLDNDLFAGTDRNYTNGLRLSWISEDKPLFNFLPGRRRLEQLATASGGYDRIGLLSGFDAEAVRDKTLQLNYGLSLTQLMFTPDDAASPVQPPGERRYAGWLGLGFSVHARDEQAVNSAELILGTTGNHSLARQAQNLVHDLGNIDRFEGWNDQIPSEPTLDLSFLQKRLTRFLPERATGFGVDGLTEWGLRLGTFRTDIRAGGFFRVGFNLPVDFSDPRLSATAYSHRYFNRSGRESAPWSAYVLFGATGNGVMHDASLDGPLFRSFDTGNTREPWVGEVFTGFGLRWASVEFSYVHTWRSREYVEKSSGGFDFGTLALRVLL